MHLKQQLHQPFMFLCEFIVFWWKIFKWTDPHIDGHLFVPNDKLAYIRNGNVLEKCPGNGVNTTDDAFLNPDHIKLAFWGSLGHFPAPPQPGEPISGTVWIPIATWHASGLVLTMIMSPKQPHLKRKMPQNVWFGSLSYFYSFTVSLPCFCLFLTDLKHYLGTSIHSAFQELQFECKRRFLAHFV